MDFQPTQSVMSDGSVLADVVNHCKNYKAYMVGDSVPSSVHEISHCIHADLRNGALAVTDPGLIEGGTHFCNLYRPLITGTGPSRAAFYLLNNRAEIVETDLGCRKHDATEFIPRSLEYHRFGTYVTGQKEWDDTPLYIFDEWCAYQNGAAAVIDMFARGVYHDGASDYIFGPLEFVAYATGVLMAGAKRSTLTPELITLSKLLFNRTMQLFTTGISSLPWAEANECLEKLQHSTDWNTQRTFLKDVIGFDIMGGGDEPVDFSA